MQNDVVKLSLFVGQGGDPEMLRRRDAPRFLPRPLSIHRRLPSQGQGIVYLEVIRFRVRVLRRDPPGPLDGRRRRLEVVLDQSLSLSVM